MDLGYAVLVLVIYVLACARLTRLVNADTILDGPRLAVARRARNDDASSSERARWAVALYWLQCPWCVGFWICLAGGYVPVRLIGWPGWVVLPLGLAASHLVGVFAFAAATEDIEVEEG